MASSGSVRSLQKTVDGTAITATIAIAQRVYIQAHPDNNTAIYVFDADVSSSTKTGIFIPIPASSVPAAPIMLESSAEANGINLQDLKAASAGSSQKLNILYIVG